MKKKFLSNLLLVLILNVVIKPLYILGIDAEILKITEQNDPGSYGTYFSLLSLSFIFNIILDLGVNSFNTRNIAQNNQLLEKHFSRIFSLKLILCLLYIIVLISVGFIFDFSSLEMKWLAVIGFNQILIALILFIRSNLSALLLFKKDSILSIIDRLILILLCGYFLWAKKTNEIEKQLTEKKNLVAQLDDRENTINGLKKRVEDFKVALNEAEENTNIEVQLVRKETANIISELT